MFVRYGTGMSWFRRRKDEESMDPQVLLAQAHEAIPPTLVKAPGPFRMTIADVFTIVGRGTVVTGQVESGSVSTGDTVRLTGPGGAPRKIEIAGVEMFRKQVDTANSGDKVGLLLCGVDKQSLGQGDVLTA